MDRILNDVINSGVVEKKKDIYEFSEIIKKCKENYGIINKEQIIKIYEILRYDLSIDNMNGNELSVFCEYLNKTVVGFDEMKRIRIRKEIKKIRKDDKAIMMEGVNSMSQEELIYACKERRIPYEGLSKENMEKMIEDWLDLSIYHKIPLQLLFMINSLNNK